MRLGWVKREQGYLLSKALLEVKEFKVSLFSFLFTTQHALQNTMQRSKNIKFFHFTNDSFYRDPTFLDSYIIAPFSIPKNNQGLLRRKKVPESSKRIQMLRYLLTMSPWDIFLTRVRGEAKK
jgi:hypothetical protein